jgi:hypothetical protein
VAATLFWLFLTVSRHQLIIYLSFVSFQVLILVFHFFPSSKENKADVKAFVSIYIKQQKTICGEQVLSGVKLIQSLVVWKKFLGHC